MNIFDFIAASILLWAWMCPHDLGQWIERVRDPWRAKPIHRKKKRSTNTREAE